jgi:hypothetical protein
LLTVEGKGFILALFKWAEFKLFCSNRLEKMMKI